MRDAPLMFYLLKKLFSYCCINKRSQQVYTVGLIMYTLTIMLHTLISSIDVFKKGFLVILFACITLSELNTLISPQQTLLNTNLQQTITLIVLSLIPRCFGVYQSQVLRLSLYLVACSKYKLVISILLELFHLFLLYFWFNNE